MAARTDYIECQFQRRDSTGHLRCSFCDTDWKEYPGGCLSGAKLPLVSSLLDERAKESREGYREEIRQAVASGNASLALGAGISIPMEMPNWLSLVSKMAGYAQQYVDYSSNSTLKDPEDIRRLRAVLEQELTAGSLTLFNGVNVLESGQYIEQTLNRAAGGKPSQELIKETLSIIIEQSLSPADWTDKKWKESYPTLNPTEHLKLAAEHNSLCAVAYLLYVDHGFRRAITYNFDTLVQEYLIDIFGVSPDRIFTHPGVRSKYPRAGIKDPIDIFHVHGCIPRKASLETPSCAFPGESGQIILTESSYYNTEQSWAYNWQNSIQSYYMNRDSCVFVGFSADDYNFRRILKHLQVGVHPKHYLILTIDNVAKEAWAAVCRRHLFSSTSQEDIQNETLQLLKIQLDMKSEYWICKGFYPIWVTVNDIPKFLLSLI